MKPQTRIPVDRYIKRIKFKHLSMQPKCKKKFASCVNDTLDCVKCPVDSRVG
jgi:hypothetical protein